MFPRGHYAVGDGGRLIAAEANQRKNEIGLREDLFEIAGNLDYLAARRQSGLSHHRRLGIPKTDAGDLGQILERAQQNARMRMG